MNFYEWKRQRQVDELWARFCFCWLSRHLMPRWVYLHVINHIHDELYWLGYVILNAHPNATGTRVANGWQIAKAPSLIF